MAPRQSDCAPVCTIGHSTRSIAEFVDLLRVAEVTMLIDVRTVPRSRTNPQYNLDRLAEELAPYQIGHEYIAELGGLRGRSPDIAPETNALWRNQSFHNYADYALSDEFRRGLERLKSLAARHRCAVMCAEAVWWRCHRRIIADYLLAMGRTVLHLMWPRRIEPAHFTPGAVALGDGRVGYPAPDAGDEGA